MEGIGVKRFQANTCNQTQAPFVKYLMNVNDEVWTVNELADMLGLTKWAILKRIQRGCIPAHKQGNFWYILKSEYIDLLKNSNCNL